MNWEKLCDRVVVTADRNRNREKAMIEHARQYAHYVPLFLFFPVIIHSIFESEHDIT